MTHNPSLRNRIICWWKGHEPEDWDKPEWGGARIFGQMTGVKQYRCKRDGRLFWQYGGFVGRQVMDDDPRLNR